MRRDALLVLAVGVAVCFLRLPVVGSIVFTTPLLLGVVAAGAGRWTSLPVRVIVGLLAGLMGVLCLGAFATSDADDRWVVAAVLVLVTGLAVVATALGAALARRTVD